MQFVSIVANTVSISLHPQGLIWRSEAVTRFIYANDFRWRHSSHQPLMTVAMMTMVMGQRRYEKRWRRNAHLYGCTSETTFLQSCRLCRVFNVGFRGVLKCRKKVTSRSSVLLRLGQYLLWFFRRVRKIAKSYYSNFKVSPCIFNSIIQRFSNFFQVGTTFISQNVLRTTLLLGLSNSLGLP